MPNGETRRIKANKKDTLEYLNEDSPSSIYAS